MQYKVGQKVWIWRGDSEKPYSATITGYVGKSSTLNDVYEFDYKHPVLGCNVSSGCADFDIYKTEEMAQKAYKKYINSK